jgi:hypothetical protein
VIDPWNDGLLYDPTGPTWEQRAPFSVLLGIAVCAWAAPVGAGLWLWRRLR